MYLLLINKTKYSYKDLASFVRAGIRAYYKHHEGRRLPRRYTVRVNNFKGSQLGCAPYFRNDFTIYPSRAPGDKPMSKNYFGEGFCVEQMAEVIMHEMQHNDGKHHAEMHSNYLRAWGMDDEKAWWRKFEGKIGLEQPVVKKQKLPEAKIFRLQTRREAWISKKKRAENAIKKIDKSLKYYERKQAAKVSV